MVQRSQSKIFKNQVREVASSRGSGEIGSRTDGWADVSLWLLAVKVVTAGIRC